MVQEWEDGWQVLSFLTFTKDIHVEKNAGVVWKYHTWACYLENIYIASVFEKQNFIWYIM